MTLYPVMAELIKDLSNSPPCLSKIIPSIRSVNRSQVQISKPFPEMVRRFSRQSGTVILLSGTSLDCARYNILAAKPWLTITARKRDIELTVMGKSFSFQNDPLDTLHNLLSLCAIPWAEELCPISAGLFGYLSYDLKERIEHLPNTCIDQNLPDLFLCAPSFILLHDRHTDTVEQIELTLSYEGDEIEVPPSYYQAVGSDESDIGTFSIDPSGLSSTFSKSEYIEAVEKIIDYIKAGDIYQANLSQRFSARFQGDPYTLFLKLFKKNPAPFFSFVNGGDHQVISTSPERFIQRNGEKIETRPIKGTIQRGKDAGEDRALGEALLASLKDQAELSMIVDLMRNDLGKVAKGGTVRVKEHKRLEPYDNVFHLVSIVDATLSPEKSTMDLIRATFPGGSITGCPKIRSMEVIDELESVRRHVYTGSVGYISFHDTLDLSIAIRTAVVADGKIGFSVGGGIVFDSDPESEYEETLHKGRTIMEALIESGDDLTASGGSDHSPSGSALPKNGLPNSGISTPKAWVNGKIVDEAKVVVPARFTGFQYGAGLFETMRVEKGRVVRLKEHLERISSSWRTLFKENIPEITWNDVIDKVLRLNGLEDRTAAVKLMVARGARGAEDEKLPSVDGDSDFVALFARPYIHRLVMKRRAASNSCFTPHSSEEEQAGDGLDLITFPEFRHTPLAAHKSLNYLYYHLASLYAKQHGCDEALICNADGTISETNSASVIAISTADRKVFLPQSDYALPGVTLNCALDHLLRAGYEMKSTKITPAELCSMDNVLVLNSLIGAVRVLSVDSHTICHTDNGICDRLNRALFKVNG